MALEADDTGHFDELLTAREDQAIYLAKFHIVANQSAFFIEKVTRNPFHQYLPNVQLLELLQGLERPQVRPRLVRGRAHVAQDLVGVDLGQRNRQWGHTFLR